MWACDIFSSTCRSALEQWSTIFFPAWHTYNFPKFCGTPRSLSNSDVTESFLSSQSHKPFESESSQSYLNFFRVESIQSHDLVELSQSRVTRTVESLRVIGLQARVNGESHEISRIFYDIFLLWNGAQRAIKWRPISLKIVPNMLWNGAW